jgi:hypothetical protein
VEAMMLRGGQDRPPDGLGQRDRAKQRLWIEIVVAGFIDDPDEAVRLGIGVAKRDVDFSSLQLCQIAFVVHAHDELPCLRFCHGSIVEAGA